MRTEEGGRNHYIINTLIIHDISIAGDTAVVLVDMVQIFDVIIYIYVL